ncbi:XRE family transcriptional regulator [Vibrio lentus]|uniref:Cro/Cl family transcriptional regulator n=1 Tax=Vibrio lentus TaxID=136468 RepID=A0A2N7K4W4_9VIBR|nr:XRE family transcriptional regulator [Vibrio lentus]PMM69316.1 Cro/Cl family transcriptional regulator [Vibrio lentus]
MSLGHRIKKARENNLGISKKELALRLGVSQSAVNQWENDVNLPSQKRLIELCEVFKESYEWLINGAKNTNDDDLFEVPFYEEIHCSAGVGYYNGHSDILMISGHLIPIPPEDIAKHTIALRIHGDSMEPAISDNGVVFVDTSDTKIIDGKIYVYKTDDVLRVKRFEHSVSGLIIKSLNPEYADEKVSHKEFSQSCIIGRVLYSINKF